jgi:hypothetical protein
VLKNGIAAAFAKKRFVAHQHVSRLQLPRLKFGEKAIRLTEGAHHD